MKRPLRIIFIILTTAALAFAGLFIFSALQYFGDCPIGKDTMNYLYKGNFLLESMSNGNFFPLYDTNLFNMSDVMGSSMPLAAYVIAGCQYVAGGVFDGYLAYIALLFFIGAMSWFVIGLLNKTPVVGAVIGLLWFFMPNNLVVLLVDGTLEWSLCFALLPIYLYGVFSYVYKGRISSVAGVIAGMFLLIISSAECAIAVALITVIYLVIHGIMNKRFRKSMSLIPAIMIAAVLAGFFVVPYYAGGAAGKIVGGAALNILTSFTGSLNPVTRYLGDYDTYYFGAAALLLCVFGIVGSYKETKSGFLTAVVVFLLITLLSNTILTLIFGTGYSFAIRAISVALCIALMSFMFWNTLKKPIIILAFVILLADIVPSVKLLFDFEENITVDEQFDFVQEMTLLDEAKDITNQRMAYIDMGTMESTGSWLVTSWNGKTASTFGFDNKEATTYYNTSQIEEATAGGYFYYLFDRLLELGNDTVLLQMSVIDSNEDTETIDSAAKKLGYELYDSNSMYRLYHMEVEGSFGVVSEYDAIAIGSGAPAIALDFPIVQETSSNKLDDYTFEELCDYKLVYLAGFTFDDRDYAENLIKDLSESGVRIIIAADGIPEDRKTHDQSFLGVTCSTISFSNGYPEFDTVDGIINADLFPSSHTEWTTVYVTGLDEVWGSLYDNGFELDFYGTKENENIVFIGLNLTYFYGLTEDESIGKLISRAMNIESDEMPVRDIVPLEIEYSNNKIIITSEEDNVNTTLAYINAIKDSDEIYEVNNFVYVDAGTTVIELEYPYWIAGIIVSGVGILLMAGYFIILYRNDRKVIGANKNENV